MDEDGDTVTAAVCDPCDPSASGSEPRLTRSEAAAFNLIVEMTANSESVSEKDWRAVAVNGFAVSGSENRESRARAVSRAMQGLAAKSLIHVEDGDIRLSTIEGMFDDLEGPEDEG